MNNPRPNFPDIDGIAVDETYERDVTIRWELAVEIAVLLGHVSNMLDCPANSNSAGMFVHSLIRLSTEDPEIKKHFTDADALATQILCHAARGDLAELGSFQLEDLEHCPELYVLRAIAQNTWSPVQTVIPAFTADRAEEYIQYIEFLYNFYGICPQRLRLSVQDVLGLNLDFAHSICKGILSTSDIPEKLHKITSQAYFELNQCQPQPSLRYREDKGPESVIKDHVNTYAGNIRAAGDMFTLLELGIVYPPNSQDIYMTGSFSRSHNEMRPLLSRADSVTSEELQTQKTWRNRYNWQETRLIVNILLLTATGRAVHLEKAKRALKALQEAVDDETNPFSQSFSAMKEFYSKKLQDVVILKVLGSDSPAK